MSATPNEIFLSIVIPAYNEEKRIRPTLAKIAQFLPECDFQSEVIVVSDGSTDDTVKVAESFGRIIPQLKVVDRQENRGKGYSVAEGVTLARGEYILFSDADLSTPIEDFYLLKAKLDEGYSVAIGSRDLPESNVAVAQPWYRRFMGLVFRTLVSALTVKGFKDTQCGFKAFTQLAAKDIFSRLTIDGFGFDVEALYIADKLGYRIAEVPVTWVNSTESKVNVITDPIKMFADLLVIRHRHRELRATLPKKQQYWLGQ